MGVSDTVGPEELVWGWSGAGVATARPVTLCAMRMAEWDARQGNFPLGRERRSCKISQAGGSRPVRRAPHQRACSPSVLLHYRVSRAGSFYCAVPVVCYAVCASPCTPALGEGPVHAPVPRDYDHVLVRQGRVRARCFF